jgi:hypothetical protein
MIQRQRFSPATGMNLCGSNGRFAVLWAGGVNDGGFEGEMENLFHYPESIRRDAAGTLRQHKLRFLRAASKRPPQRKQDYPSRKRNGLVIGLVSQANLIEHTERAARALLVG